SGKAAPIDQPLHRGACRRDESALPSARQSAACRDAQRPGASLAASTAFADADSESGSVWAASFSIAAGSRAPSALNTPEIARETNQPPRWARFRRDARVM